MKIKNFYWSEEKNKNLDFSKIEEIKGYADLKGCSSDLSSLKEIGGYANLTGCYSDLSSLKEIEGSACLEGCTSNLSNLKEIGGNANLTGCSEELKKSLAKSLKSCDGIYIEFRDGALTLKEFKEMYMAKPKKKKSKRQKLIKEIDDTRRDYIRKRDNDGDYTKCISCGAYCITTSLQVGHYYSRSHDFTTTLGSDERNVNLQCSPCNGVKHGNPRGYALGIIRKYGNRAIEELGDKKNQQKYWKIKDLEENLEMWKTLLDKIS